MPQHNIFCTICKEVFTRTDDIYSTNCGHLFHFACMRECQSRSTCCPVCQHHNPFTHKMYLFFQERNDNSSDNWKDKLKVIELHKEIEERKDNYEHLQGKYVLLQKNVQKLEERIRVSNSGISRRSSLVQELEERIKTLEELNEFLTIDNECKTQALASKIDENMELKKACLNENNQILEPHLDNIKINKAKNLKKIETNDEIGASSNIMNDTLTFHKSDIKSKKLACTFDSLKLPEKLNSSATNSTYDEQSKTRHQDELETTSADHSILIKNFPKDKIIRPLKNLIVTFVTCRQGYIIQDDINDVYIKNREGNAVTLFVQFKNHDLKTKFLQNKVNIQQIFPSLELTDNLMDDQVIENVNTNKVVLQRSDENPTEANLNTSNITENPTEICTNLRSRNQQDLDYFSTSTDRSILIKNFPKDKLIYPLKDLIVTFVSCQQGHVTQDDISEACIKHRKGNIITLFVQFKNSHLKTKFLQNKSSIDKIFPSLELTDDLIEDQVIENINMAKAVPQKLQEIVKPKQNQFENNINSSSSDCTSILIKNFPKNKLKYPLKNLICSFVNSKQEFIIAEDVEEVNVKDRYGKRDYQLPKNITLFVKFKNTDLKNKFLQHEINIKKMFPFAEITQLLQQDNKVRTQDLVLENNTVTGILQNKTENLNTDILNNRKSEQTILKDSINSSITQNQTKTTTTILNNQANNCETKENQCQGSNCNSSINHHSILIENFPKNKLRNPLTEFIASIASGKRCNILKEDINEVYIKDHNSKNDFSQLPNKVALFIQFKNKDIKAKFLRNKYYIKKKFPSIELKTDINQNNNINEDVVKENNSNASDLPKKSEKEEHEKLTLDIQDEINSLIPQNFNTTMENNRESQQIILKESCMQDNSSSSITQSEIENCMGTNTLQKNHVSNCDSKQSGLQDNPNSSNSHEKEEHEKLRLDIEDRINSSILQNLNNTIEHNVESQQIILKESCMQDNLNSLITQSQAENFKTTNTLLKNHVNNCDSKQIGLQDNPNYSVVQGQTENSNITYYDSKYRSLQTDINSCNDHSVLIKNFPKNKLRNPLRDLVATFASGKQGYLSQDDIIEVFIKDHDCKTGFHQLPYKVTLFVQFRNDNIKAKFLRNKYNIKKKLPSVEIIDNSQEEELVKENKMTASTTSLQNSSSASIISTQSDKKEGLNSSTDHSILIKNFPKNNLKNPLRNTITIFISGRQGYISQNDISNIYIKDRNQCSFYHLPQEITLFVQFKTNFIKNKFLRNKGYIQEMFPSVVIDVNNKDFATEDENITSTTTLQNHTEDYYALPSKKISSILKANRSDRMQTQSNKELNSSTVPTENNYALANIQQCSISEAKPSDRMKSPSNKQLNYSTVPTENCYGLPNRLQSSISEEKQSDRTQIQSTKELNFSTVQTEDYYSLPTRQQTSISEAKHHDRMQSQFNKELCFSTVPIEKSYAPQTRQHSSRSEEKHCNRMQSQSTKELNSSTARKEDYYALPTRQQNSSSQVKHSDRKQSQPNKELSASTARTEDYYALPTRQQRSTSKAKHNDRKESQFNKELKSSTVPKENYYALPTRQQSSISEAKPSDRKQSQPNKELSASTSRTEDYYALSTKQQSSTSEAKHNDRKQSQFNKDFNNKDFMNEKLIKESISSIIALPTTTNEYYALSTRQQSSKTNNYESKQSDRKQSQSNKKLSGSTDRKEDNYAFPTRQLSSRNNNSEAKHWDRQKSQPYKDLSSSTDPSIYIKYFPKNKLTYPLQKLITTIIPNKEEFISQDDITEIYINRDGRSDFYLPNKITLFVKFKNIFTKAKFLRHKTLIKQLYPSVQITDGMQNNNDNPEDVLKYAKEKLSSNGFKFIFRENNDVMALKDLNDSQGIRISTKADVDKILKSHHRK